MKTATENHSYRESGLTCVTLVNVDVLRCSSCGEFEVAIPAIEQLHALIARSVDIPEPEGAELRFGHTADVWHALAAAA